MIHGRPDQELVGAFVRHEEKAGRDVGEIAEIRPIDLVADTFSSYGS